MTIILIIAATMLLTPPIGYLWIRSIEKANAKLNPSNFIVRWSRTFFWVTAGLGSVPLVGIIYMWINLIDDPMVGVWTSLFFLIPMFVAVLFCYYFLRKKIVISAIEQILLYSPAFRKKIKIEFMDIEKIMENQHGLSLFRKGNPKKVFSIGNEYIGYEMFKDILKKYNHIIFEYQEVGIGKSF